MPHARGSLGFVATLVALALSGCVAPGGDDDAASGATGAEPALRAPVVVTSTTGAVEGFVLSEAYKPLVGANVTLQRSDDPAAAPTATRTDREGGFGFDGLAPGGYRLEARSLGHDAVVLLVTVEAGRSANVLVTLPELSAPVAHVEPHERRGHIGCAAAGFRAGQGNFFLVPCAGSDPNTANTWLFDLPETAVTMVVTVDWQARGFLLGGEMQVFVESCVSPSQVTCPDGTYGHAAGGSPLVVRVEGADLVPPKPFENGTSPFRVRVAPGSSSETTPSLLLEQSFMLYVTFFHVDPAPRGFTGIPDA